MPQLPFQLYKWVDDSIVADVNGVTRPISDPQSLAQYGYTPEQLSALEFSPLTGQNPKYPNPRGGTTGGAESLATLLGTYQGQQAQPAPGPAPKPATQPGRPTTGLVASAGPSPATQPTEFVATSNPNDYYKIATGRVNKDGTPHYDVYSKTHGKLSGDQLLNKEGTGFVVNVDHVPEQAEPNAPSAPPQGAPTSEQPTTQPPETQGKEGAVIPGVDGGKDFIQYAGSPDIFQKSTGEPVTAQQAEEMGLFAPEQVAFGGNLLSNKVEVSQETRPDVNAEEDFAALQGQKIQTQIANKGATTTIQDFEENPLQAFSRTYREMLEASGVAGFNAQIDEIKSELKGIDEKYADKIQDINDNPWLSEAERSRRVKSEDSRYQNLRGSSVDRLTLFQNAVNEARDEAKFFASTALNFFQADREFDFQVLQDALDRADTSVKANTQIVEVGGRMVLVDKNTGEVLQDIGAGKAPTVKELTQGQRLAAGFASRVGSSSKVIDEVGDQFTGVALGAFLPEGLKSEDRKLFEQASRNFINATLRRESGAAIAPSEFENAELQYLPARGDTDAVLEQKKQNRAVIQKSLELEAGAAFTELQGALPPPSVDISDLDFSF